MGLYIKGMKMPTSCEKCPFLDYEEGFCFASGVKGKSGWYEFTWCPSGIKDGRHKDCPLVPVPPHGRLIDADALAEHKFVCIPHVSIDGKDVGTAYRLGWNTAIEAVMENAETIMGGE